MHGLPFLADEEQD